MNTKTKSEEKQVAVVGSSIEALIAKAIDSKVDVATMERLLAMRRELKAEWAKAQFDKALAAFQAECPTIKKTEEVLEKDKKTIRYKYAPLDSILEQVKGILAKHGFSYSVNALHEPGFIGAICKVTHTAGHSELSVFKVPIGAESYMSEVQKYGARMTFAKRYAFCNAFGILTGDGDTDAKEDSENAQCEAEARNGNIHITTKQKGYLKGLLKRKGYSDSDVSRKYNVSGLDELTSRQASQIIENLQKLPDGEAIDVEEVAEGIERNRVHAS